MIINKFRDGADGVYIYDASNHLGPEGPTINPGNNDPDTTNSGVMGPELVERFTRITNSTLTIYYIIGTWNPYTAVKMRSQFAILPVMDPASAIHKRNKFSFAWTGVANEHYVVQYSTNLSSPWTTFTNIITSTNRTFTFTNELVGGLPSVGFYRVRTAGH